MCCAISEGYSFATSSYRGRNSDICGIGTELRACAKERQDENGDEERKENEDLACLEV